MDVKYSKELIIFWVKDALDNHGECGVKRLDDDMCRFESHSHDGTLTHSIDLNNSQAIEALAVIFEHCNYDSSKEE